MATPPNTTLLEIESQELARQLDLATFAPLSEPDDPRLASLWRVGQRLAHQGQVMREFNSLREALGLPAIHTRHELDCVGHIRIHVNEVREGSSESAVVSEGWDAFARLDEAAAAVREALRGHPGTVNVSHALTNRTITPR